jgi:glutathione S-transferase
VNWLAAGRFTAADLLMADILRLPKVRSHDDRPATERYVARVTSRPAFRKAHSDQLAWLQKVMRAGLGMSRRPEHARLQPCMLQQPVICTY